MTCTSCLRGLDFQQQIAAVYVSEVGVCTESIQFVYKMALTLCLEDRASAVRNLISKCLPDSRKGNFKQNESQYMD
jgi:hypothetical protein